MKKLFALLTALTCLFATVAAAENAYTVGVCQLVQHPALDAAAQGFSDALTTLLGADVTIEVENASGDSATCIAIVNGFISADVDLIIANATQSLQAAHAATGDIPILGMSVTDYAAALDLDEWNGVTGQNVSGTSDLAPLDGQAELIRELFPDAATVGLLYCSSEANSIYQVEIISELLGEMGYSCTRYPFTDTNDVASITQNACDGSDVIFVPTDNTVASCAQVIRNVVEVERIPLVGGDEGICTACGVATLSIDYYALGYATGEMAFEVLVNGADVSEMPVRFAPDFSKIYNAELCALLDVDVPADCEAIE